MPTIPGEAPRFTAVAADYAGSTPTEGSAVQPGEVEFSFTLYYQVGPDWAGEPLDMWFLVRGWSNDVFVAFLYTDVVEIVGDDGTMRFQGTFIVPDCGAIDEIDLVGRIYEQDTDFEFYIDQDGYVVDAVNTSSAPCPA